MNNPPTPDCTFGEWLKAEMQARRWTPAELARRSGLSSVAGFLNDSLGTSYVARIRLARALGLSEQTIHARYAEGRPLALERARAEKLAKVSQDFRTLLETVPASKSRWQEQWLLEQFQRLPVEDRAVVLANIADLPTLRKDFLAQLNALLLTLVEVCA